MQPHSTANKMKSNVIRATLLAITAVGTFALTSLPAAAEKWPGQAAAPGGALAARVIGFMCVKSLSPKDIFDLDLYLAQKRAQANAEKPEEREKLIRIYTLLEAEYFSMYRDGKRCDAGQLEMARDMVQRVRSEITAVKPKP